MVFVVCLIFKGRANHVEMRCFGAIHVSLNSSGVWIVEP